MTDDQPASSPSLPPANPFSTSAVRPGALDYQFPPGDSLDKVVSRLRADQWWGEIIGPHGSGKSTLLQSLRAALMDAGRTVQLFTLTSGQRQLPCGVEEMSAWDDRTQVIVDGFEQLGWWPRRGLKRTCRKSGCGLLITAHGSFGFPPLLTSQTSLEQTQQLVATLLPHPSADHVSQDDIAAAFSRHAGNVREVFFDLYDRFEQRARR